MTLIYHQFFADLALIYLNPSEVIWVTAIFAEKNLLLFTANVINFRKNHPENCTHKQKEGQLNVAKMNISNQTVKSN